MIRAALLILTLRAACAQTPAVIDYPTAPTIKSAVVGTLRCDFFGHHPGANQEQTACYLNGVLVVNAVVTTGTNLAVTCRATVPPTGISWAFIPGTTGVQGYQLMADIMNASLPFFFGPLPIQAGNAAKEGMF